MHADHRAMSPSRRLPKSAMIVPGLGICFALLFAAQNYYRSHVLGVEASLSQVLLESLTRWLFYAALAPAVGWLVFRVPLESGRLRARVPLHVAGAVLFAVVHCVATGLVYRAFHVYPREDSLGEAIRRLLLVFFGLDFVNYWTISGVYHAIRYHEETRSRELIATELRMLLIEARLQALRAQLNPHFLFNTLNATSVLALTGERDQVVRMLGALSELLRVALDRELPQEIPLSRELDILDRYLEIQRIRFGDRLTVEVTIEPAARAASLPSMALQPLVENALQHGIAARPGPGILRVNAHREGGDLVVRVEDSGPGFAAVERVTGADVGIGLGNTRERIDQLYGSAGKLVCGNLSAGGAFVELRLPWHGDVR